MTTGQLAMQATRCSDKDNFIYMIKTCLRRMRTLDKSLTD